MGRHSRPEAQPEQPERSGRRAVLLVALALVAAVIAVAVFVSTRDDDDQVTADPGTATVASPGSSSAGSSPPSAGGSTADASTPAPSTPAPDTSTAPVTPTPTPTPTATAPAPAATPKAPPLLTFTVTAASWISVTGPDGQIVGRVFPKGAKAAYDARELTVRTGNAGGVQFVISGKKRRLGASGQIEEFTVRKR